MDRSPSIFESVESETPSGLFKSSSQETQSLSMGRQCSIVTLFIALVSTPYVARRFMIVLETVTWRLCWLLTCESRNESSEYLRRRGTKTGDDVPM